jgi:hypothetical protein
MLEFHIFLPVRGYSLVIGRIFLSLCPAIATKHIVLVVGTRVLLSVAVLTPLCAAQPPKPRIAISGKQIAQAH